MIKKSNEETNKKLISFKNYEFINGIVQDKAILSGTNDSAVIEKILLKEFLPESCKAAYFVKDIYKHGLKAAFMLIMQEISAGLSIRVSLPETSLYALVKFVMKVVLQFPSLGIDSDYEDLFSSHFAKNCQVIKKKLELENGKNKDTSLFEKQYLEDTIFLLSLKESMDFNPFNYFELVLHYWAYLGADSYTYKLLYDCVCLSKQENWLKPDYRIRAVEVIRENVDDKWDF